MTDLIGNIIKNSRGRELKIEKLFGGSTYYIYNLTLNDEDSGLLLKEIPFLKNPSYRENSYENEVKFLTIASSLDVSPKLIHHEIITKKYKNDVKKVGIIIFEKYGEGTVTDLFEKGIMNDINYLKSVRRQIKIILKILYDNNISHNDLHTHNFLYHYDSKKDKYNIKIIDFDVSTLFRNTNKRNYMVRIIGPNTSFSVSNEKPMNKPSKKSSNN